MKRFAPFLLFVFALTLANGAAFAQQETGGVKGKVRASTGDGIAAATVTARQNGTDVKSATADGKGNFVLDNLKPGIYNLVFSKSGYSSGVLYNVEVRKKKIGDLKERLILTVDQGSQVIIKGSVFLPDGRSFGGAEIKIERVSADGTTEKVGSSVSTYSGEFTFRFAEGAAKYRVTASMKDAKASKEVEVDGAAIYRLAITLNSTNK